MNDFFNNFNHKELENFSNLLCKLTPLEFITLGSVTAILITQYLNPNEQNTLGNFLEMIGQILLTSYAQASVVDPNFISLSILQGKELQSQINHLFSIINTTK